MKKTLLTLALVATTVAAFAQGKVGFVNDSLHLFVLGDVAQGDLAGPIATNSTAGSGVTLIAGLFAGTSSGSLTLQSTTTPLTGTGLPQPGRMASRNTVLTVPGGVAQFFRIVIYDSTDLTPADAAGGAYWGASGIFTAIPGTSITYPSIMPGGPSASTLGAGNIVVNAIPEPTSFALAGLGLASLVIFRRRK